VFLSGIRRRSAHVLTRNTLKKKTMEQIRLHGLTVAAPRRMAPMGFVHTYKYNDSL
jgi:hypothetical protein